MDIRHCTMDDVGAVLRGLGLRFSVDDDGDLTFTMRLAGEATREDGSADWSRLRYKMETDFSMSGEFVASDDYTDWAKRIVRFFLIGSSMCNGFLEIHAYPKVVPAKFERTGHIRIVPPQARVDEFNRSETTGLRATLFSDGGFAITCSVSGNLDNESLRQVIAMMEYAAARFLFEPFRGLMFMVPA